MEFRSWRVYPAVFGRRQEAGMSDGMFQKEFNDEIYARDMDIENPCPERLEMRSGESGGQVFSARAGWVLRCIYSDLESLAAFGNDDAISYYACYSRKTHGKDRLFIMHEEGRAAERVEIVDVDEMKDEARELIPSDLRE